MRDKAALIAERILYLLTVAVTPSIPLFFLFGRNAEQALKFSHFLIFNVILAVISLVLYFLISGLYLRRRRTVLLLSVFWLIFWTFPYLFSTISKITVSLSQAFLAACITLLIVIIANILRRIPVNRSIVNTVAVILCVLFIYNFLPNALSVSAINKLRAENEIAADGGLSFEVKTEFTVNHGLPKPNIYWLHMDTMVGFDAIEAIFDDSQQELKEELAERGFTVNDSARIEAGRTRLAIPVMFSPILYDSFFAEEFSKVTDLTSDYRQTPLHNAMVNNGFSFDDIWGTLELIRAFSDSGYFIAASSNIMLHRNNDFDLLFEHLGGKINVLDDDISAQIAAYNEVMEFVNLIADASALSIFEDTINEIAISFAPQGAMLTIPQHPDIAGRYFPDGLGEFSWYTAPMINATEYAATLQKPSFVLLNNDVLHYYYDEEFGRIFRLDENGNTCICDD